LIGSLRVSKGRKAGVNGKGNDATAQRGLVTHLAVAQKLVERGYEVLQPLGDHLRYDLAYYVPSGGGVGPFGRQEARLVRIQCKTARISEDQSCLKFNTYNMTGGRGMRRSYRGDVEFFGVYSSDTGKVYLIPVDVVPEGGAILRLKRPKNNQEKRVIWAKDYEV
jgi:hypothetical protein